MLALCVLGALQSQSDFTVNGTAAFAPALDVRQLALDLAAPPAPTLDNFVPGRNAELLESLKRLAAGTSREHIFYLWGESGSGRTHLLKAMIGALQSTGAAVAYVACESDAGLEDGLDRMDFVALDDIDRLGPKMQEIAFSLYNTLRSRGVTLVASGAAPPAQLTLRSDLVTRLGWGLVYRVHGLTDGDKAKALAEQAAARGFCLPGDVGEYLLTHTRRDLPSLLAMLDALDRRSRETKRPVTVALVRELFHAADASSAESVNRGAG